MTQPDIPREDDSFARRLAEARAGSREALGQLLSSFYDELQYQAYRHRGPDGLRSKWNDSDLVQVTLLDAQCSFAQFHGTTREELLAWLIGILAHNSSDWQASFLDTAKRELTREISLDDEHVGAVLRAQLQSDTPPPDWRLQKEEVLAALRKGLQELPEHYAQVIRMHYYDHLSFDKIGEALGCTSGAARELERRARKMLAKSLDGII